MAAATHDASAERDDDQANSFWGRFGGETVARLGLQPGARVLDVCCGSRASALDTDARERVRAANLDVIRTTGTSSVETNVVYAIATKL